MTSHDLHRDPAQVPDGFRSLVREQMEKCSLSLRTVAAQADISPAYLSRLLSGERGLPPDNALILALAQVLRIDPPELLLIEAKRVPTALLPALLSAHHATTKVELEGAMKKLQALILAQRRKKGPKS